MTSTATATAPTALAVAGLASLGAGVIHATAAGLHGEHRQAAVAFALLAAFQVTWGVLALVQAPRVVIALGALGNAVALGGWLMTRISGIGFIDGLEAAESAGFADSAAAALAAATVLGALAYLVAPSRLRLPALAGPVPAAAITAALVVVAMVAATGVTHAHGDDHPTTAAGDADHDHGDSAGDTAAGQGHDPEAAPVGAVAYDGTLPVDLSGVPGVTPEQEADAEMLVTANIQALPRFADPDVAYAAGYRSVDDSDTGVEHFINWNLINDGRNLDAQYPESLVYKVEPGGGRTLEAALLEPPATLDTIPPLAGPLVQYHVHNDLCWTGEDGAYTVFAADQLPAPCPTGPPATAGAHAPRLDRRQPLRPVRRPRGHLRRPGTRRRRGPLRPRPRDALTGTGLRRLADRATPAPQPGRLVIPGECGRRTPVGWQIAARERSLR